MTEYLPTINYKWTFTTLSRFRVIRALYECVYNSIFSIWCGIAAQLFQFPHKKYKRSEFPLLISRTDCLWYKIKHFIAEIAAKIEAHTACPKNRSLKLNPHSGQMWLQPVLGASVASFIGGIICKLQNNIIPFTFWALICRCSSRSFYVSSEGLHVTWCH